MVVSSIFAVLIIGVFLLFTEWLTVHYSIPPKHSRKIVHFGASLLVIFVAWLFGWKLFILVGIIFAIVMTLMRFIHPFISLKDRSVESVGEIVFPIGVAVTAYFAQTQLEFMYIMLIVGISDTLAFYIGKYIKSAHIVFGKTIAGSSAFFVSALVFALLSGSAVTALLVASATTIAELFSTKGSDNVTIPIVATIILLIMR